MRNILLKYDGDIVSAYLAGALQKGFYDKAIGEYLERGMPKEMIEVSFYSDFDKFIITEGTFVGSSVALKNTKKLLEKEGFFIGIQQCIADRKSNTRGAIGNPNIADFLAKGLSKSVITNSFRNVFKDLKVWFVGVGDQFNDGQVEAGDMGIVANAAPIGMPGGWDFAIHMAKLAEEWKKQGIDHPIIHAEKYGDGKEINWLMIKLLQFNYVEEEIRFLREMANSEHNLEIRRWLIERKAAPGTLPYYRASFSEP